MKRKAALAFIPLVAWGAALYASPQQTPPGEKSAPAESAKKEAPRAWALGRVRLLADRIEELHDAAGKIRALTSLAETVCQDDKSFAEQIFLRANERWKDFAREEEEKNPAPGERPRYTMAIGLRGDLRTALTRCSPELALRLHEAERKAETSAGGAGESDISVASRLLSEKKDEAISLAARAMEGQPTDQTFQNFSMFLLRLRRQDAASADQLFLSTLGRLRAQPKPDSNQLMALGNYLFSFADQTKLPNFADGMGFASVGGVPVVNLQFTRPGNSPQVVRTYLEASLDMLSRPSTDARAQKLDYAAAFQLFPKARESAPDLAPGFELAMRRLDSTLPDQMKPDSPNSELSRLSRPMVLSDEEYESELEKATSPERRQWLIYQLAASAWDKHNLVRARKFAGDLENKAFRAQLLSAIDYAEAEKAVEEGRLDAALALGKDLPAGIERALLQTVMAAAQVGKGDSKPAFAMLDAAQRDAENVSLSMRPSLLVAITSVLAHVDRDASLELLTRAVTAFNARDKTEKPGETVRVFSGRPNVRGGGRPSAPEPEAHVNVNSTGFFVMVYFRGGFRSLALKAKGIDAYEVNAKLLRLFGADVERADAILSQLQDEERLGPALAALAAAYLDAAKAPPAKTLEKQ